MSDRLGFTPIGSGTNRTKYETRIVPGVVEDEDEEEEEDEDPPPPDPDPPPLPPPAAPAPPPAAAHADCSAGVRDWYA